VGDEPSCVLDASAAAAVLFREPDGLRVAPHLFGSTGVVVPQLFHLELANVGRSKIRRGEIDREHAEALLRDTSGWPLAVRQVTWEVAWPVAMEHGLTLYDAAYLQLSLAAGLPLLTLDAELIAAAADRSLL